LEQTVIQEKEKKKLSVTVAEKMIAKMTRLRTVAQTLAHENSRLIGELKGRDDALTQSLAVFVGKLESKNAETCGLKAELDALKATTKGQGPMTSQQSYAAKAAMTAPMAPMPTTANAPKATVVSNLPKSKKKNSEKEQMA